MHTQTLCHINDIDEDSAKAFSLTNSETVFAVKKDGQLFVYKNSCPHLGIELEWQENQFLDTEKNLIQCSTHGALFIIASGECIAGPCLGKSLQAISFQLNEGKIVIHY